MKNEQELYKKFKPQLTPKRMLELGVFGGAYFVDGSIKEFPKSWFIKAKLSKIFDVNLNRFKIESGLTRKDLKMEEEFLKLIKYKLNDGKLLVIGMVQR